MAHKPKTQHQVFRILAAILIASHSFFVLSLPQTTKASSGLGTGTTNNPYRITTCADLADMAGSSAHYALLNNIDCQGVTVNPLSTFPGTLDGRNLTITNLTITSVGDNIGLINWLNGGTVKNLKFTNSNVTGRNYVGVLASQVSASATISNVSVSGDVSGNIVAGGIVGLLANGSVITKSSFEGNVTAMTSNGGGLVGYSDDGNIDNSYAQAVVTGGDRLGLIAGAFNSSDSYRHITKSYVSGSVENGTNRAALIGVITGADSLTISDILISANANGGPATYALRASGPMPNISNVHFNGTALGSNTDCIEGAATSDCVAFNIDGTDGSYHLNNHANAPLDNWDFDTVWQTTLLQPTLRDATLDAITNLTVPSAPTNVYAIPSANGVSLYWGDPTDTGNAPVTGWSIQMREHGTETWGNISSNYDANAHLTGIGGGGQVEGTRFDYRIAANNAIGTGEYTVVDNVLIGDVPSSPQDFVGVNNVGGVGGTWNAPASQGSTSIVNYQFGYSITGDNSWNTYDVGGLSAGINGLNSGNYDLRVRAINSNGPSDWSYVYNFYVGPTDIVISTCQELQDIQNAPSAHYTLANDINCADTETWNEGEGFVPIEEFSGSIDGNNHTINNLYINRDQWGQALIRYTDNNANVSISNLTISNTNITALGEGAILIAYPYRVEVSNVTIVNGNVTSDYTNGGMFAYIENYGDETVSVSNSSVSVTLNGKNYVAGNNRGGIIGYAALFDDSSLQINDVTTTTNVSTAGYNAGSIAGTVELYDGGRFDAYSSTMNGELLASGSVGGLVGNLYSNSHQHPQFIDLHNQSAISGGASLGGLIGIFVTNNGYAEISDSSSIGTISGGDAATGGLVGYTSDDGNDSSLEIARSYVRSTITNTSDYTGGLVGDADIAVHISDSYFNGTITGINSVGGLLGRSANNSTSINSSYAAGTINSSGLEVGGLVGNFSGTMNNVFAAMHITANDTTDGGLVGGFNAGAITNAFVDADLSVPGCNTGLAPLELTYQCTEVNNNGSNPDYFKDNRTVDPLNDWDFTNTWRVVPNSYPDLKWVRALSPIEISSCEDLQNIQNDLGASYVLTQDIDCSDTVNWNESYGFIPMGNSYDDGFAGTLDGAGYTISHIHSSSPFGVGGIFASTTGAFIKDLNISQSDFFASDTAGAVVGYAVDTTFQNIKVNGTVTTEGSFYAPGAGGIAGQKLDININTTNSRLAFSGNVTGDQNVGGIFGMVTRQSLDDPIVLNESYSTGSVHGTSNVGGLAGQANLIFIDNSYSTSRVTGEASLGGLVGSTVFANYTNDYASGLVQASGENANTLGGFIGSAAYASITTSFATGMVLAPAEVPVGGMVGVIQPDTGVSFSYAYYNDINGTCTTSEGDPEGCYSRYSYELPDLYFGNSGQGPIDQWDFDDVWASRYNGLPQLQWSQPNNVISTCQDLQNMNNDMTANYTLANDIDCSDTVNWNDGAGFRPLGDDYNQFTGTLEGHGHTIKNLYINSTQSYGALFYKIQGGSVSSIVFDSPTIKGAPVAGTLAAYTYQTTIDSVYVKNGDIQSVGDDVMNSVTGGLVATLGNYGSITRSYFEGSVEGRNKVGGLIGWSAGGSNLIQDAYARADVLGQTDVGGLIGRIQGGLMQYTYSTGSVTATGNESGQWAGGLIGYMTSIGSTLADNFTNSVVSAPGGAAENANALIGYSDNPMNVDWGLNIFNPDHSSPTADEFACTYSEMGYFDSEGCYAPDAAANNDFFYDAGNIPLNNWNFGNLWHENYNDYPTLQPLTDPEIECEQAVRTSTTAQVACGVTPYGWGTTTWEMYYKETGKDATTEIALDNIYQARATITGLDPSKDYTIYFRFTNDWGTSEWGHIDYPHIDEDSNNNAPSKPATKTTPTTPALPLANIVVPQQLATNTETDSTITLNNFSDFTNGSGHELTLKFGQVVYFYVNGERHSATVTEIGPDYVILRVASEPQDVRISVGQAQEVSVKQNGTNDVRIRLIRVQDGQAVLSFAKITATPAKTSTQPAPSAWLLLLIIPLGYVFAIRKRRHE